MEAGSLINSGTSRIRNKNEMHDEVILVIGASGLVGSYLVRQLSTKYYKMYVTSHDIKPGLGIPIHIDLSDPNRLWKVLPRINPSIIVNLAAYTDVDGCEKNKEYAFQINSELPRIISNYVRTKRGKRDSPYLLHISTDYIFDGLKGNYDEQCEPNPINWYGKTKLFGEKEIISILGHDEDHWCIARLSTPFGIHRKKQSFPMFIINAISLGKPVNIVRDQFTSATYAKDISVMLSELIRKRLGYVIHLASSSALSRYEQAIRIAEAFDLNQDLIIECTSDSVNWVAARPKNSTLSVTKALSTLSYRPRTFEEGIHDFALEYKGTLFSNARSGGFK